MNLQFVFRLRAESTPSLQRGCVSETWETLWFLSRWVHIIVGELKRWTCVIHLLIIMDVIDAEYQCHKQNTSSQEKSCVNRASFVFMANFENFFLRFVMNSYIFFFSLLLILSITRPWNKPGALNLQSKSKTLPTGQKPLSSWFIYFLVCGIVCYFSLWIC